MMDVHQSLPVPIARVDVLDRRAIRSPAAIDLLYAKPSLDQLIGHAQPHSPQVHRVVAPIIPVPRDWKRIGSAKDVLQSLSMWCFENLSD